MEEKKNGVKPEGEENVQVKEKQVVDFVPAFDDSDELVMSEGSEKKFVTHFPIQKRTVRSGDKTYENYAVGFLVNIGGENKPHALRLRPKRKGGEILADMMQTIMQQPGEHMLEITKSFIEGTNGRTVIYSLSASCETAEGVLYVCPLEPVSVSDKAIWEVFKRQLIARGQLE